MLTNDESYESCGEGGELPFHMFVRHRLPVHSFSLQSYTGDGL